MSCKCSSCTKTFNPYAYMGIQHGKVLDYLAKKLPEENECMSVDEFVGRITVLSTSWEQITGPVSEQPTINNRLTNPFADVLSGFAARSLSHYWSATGMDSYNAMQRKFIEQILYEIYEMPAENIGCFYSNCDNRISQTSMSNEEKNPLYMATAIGKSSAAYWIKKTLEPGDWTDYLSGNYTIRYAKIAFQVCASAKGTLIGAGNAESLPKIYPLDDAVNIIAIQLASVATAGGAVVLNMLPKVRLVK